MLEVESGDRLPDLPPTPEYGLVATPPESTTGLLNLLVLYGSLSDSDIFVPMDL